jgi:hypothetical protein
MEAMEVDDPGSWPQPIYQYVEKRSEELAGTSESMLDLPIDPVEDSQFARLFNGLLLLPYHCTRLLPHEVESVRREGLAPLTEDLVRRRIEEAHLHTAINEAERDRLLDGHIFATNEADHRAGQVWFFLSRHTLDLRWNSIWRFVEFWGGEGIYWNFERTNMEDRIRTMGKPTVVRAGLKATTMEPGAIRSLLKPFVGRFLGFEDHDSEVCSHEAIPGDQIFDIWQPGKPEYDKHENLPQS